MPKKRHSNSILDAKHTPTCHCEPEGSGGVAILCYRKVAFTLAEVLITLGIIGVVAALTIPTLMQKTNEKDTVAKVKKIYSTLSNAINLAVAQNGTIDTWGLNFDATENDVKKFASVIIPYFNVVKDCSTNQTGCISNDIYKYLNGDNHVAYAASGLYYKLMLTDNTVLIFRTAGNGSCSETTSCGSFFVDINGVKKPNTHGKDTFTFLVFKNRIVPGDSNIQGFEEYDCNLNGNGRACAAYILKNDNMDYLNQ